jgi:hypothetical protein
MWQAQFKYPINRYGHQAGRAKLAPPSEASPKPSSKRDCVSGTYYLRAGSDPLRRFPALSGRGLAAFEGEQQGRARPEDAEAGEEELYHRPGDEQPGEDPGAQTRCLPHPSRPFSPVHRTPATTSLP